MDRRLRTSFTGYYGMRNFGDDLFGAICTAAAARFWDARPRLVGPPVPGVAAPCTMPGWYPADAYGEPGALGKASRLYSFVRALHGTDVLVMGGGSVITARESFRKPLMLSAQRRGRLQLAAVGVSIGPFGDAASERSAAAFLERFAYVSVRDRRSYALARRMGLEDRVHAGRDLAGLLPVLFAPAPRHPPPAPGGPLRLGVAPCRYGPRADHPTPAPAALQAALVEALTQLHGRYRLRVAVFSLNEHPHHGDLPLASALQRDLAARGVDAEHVRYRGTSPLAIVDSIAGCDAFISTRLHGAIVAYMLGVPFMIVDYHPKCADFAGDIGLPAARRLDAAHCDLDACLAGLDSLLGTQAPTLSPDVYARQAQDIFQCGPWARTDTPP